MNTMNTLSAVELKRRGIAAIEEKLTSGPVHLLKRNRPAAVILTESDYRELLQDKMIQHEAKALRWILDYDPKGQRSREDIDRQLEDERSSWESA